MTREEIIGMACKAGITMNDGRSYAHAGLVPDHIDIGALERFAALVAAKEREECINELDNFDSAYSYVVNDCIQILKGEYCN